MRLWEKKPDKPTAGILDSKSVKNTQKSDEKLTAIIRYLTMPNIANQMDC